MTLEEYIRREKARLERAVTDSRPLYLASQSALVELSKRIFEHGQTINGARYNYNDTKPLYVNPTAKNKDGQTVAFGDTSALKPPRGKPYGGRARGRTKFADGTPHQTTWVPSYKKLRELVERESSFVNFEAHGELKSDIENRSNGVPQPQKISEQEYIIGVSRKQEGKFEGLNKKFPNVFLLSESEKDTFRRTYGQQMLLLLKEGR